MKVVVLTGAGISAESGIQTFRAAEGLWEEHRVEDVATPEGFARDPELVQRFYNQRRRHLKSVAPNSAHHALSALEQAVDEFLLVTQNVDDLHERGGTQNLIHMHGELYSVYCQSCGQTWRWLDDLVVEQACPHCKRVGTVRPDIVWFGEMPKEMERIYQALATCDLFLSIGTSGHVYPAAGFVEQAKMAGAHTVELNLQPSQTNQLFDEHGYGKASELVPAYVKQFIETL